MFSVVCTRCHPAGVSVVVSGSAAKPSTAVTVGIGNDLQRRGLLQANEVVQFIASSTGGRGGGRPHFASGSIGGPAKNSSIATLVGMMKGFMEKKRGRATRGWAGVARAGRRRPPPYRRAPNARG